MTKRTLVFLAGAFVTAGAAAGTSGTTKTANSDAWTCSLTGKTVQACCCIQQKDGKLYCTLAKKTVESCCCKAAASSGKSTAAR